MKPPALRNLFCLLADLLSSQLYSHPFRYRRGRLGLGDMCSTYDRTVDRKRILVRRIPYGSLDTHGLPGPAFFVSFLSNEFYANSSEIISCSV